MKELFMKTPPIFRYLVNSCVVTVIDTIIVWVLFELFGMNLVLANTIGVVAGFLLDYLLSILFVFENATGTGGFVIYLGTFIFGLVLANVLIDVGNTVLFVSFEKNLNFLLSKGLSIVVPFFVLYVLRKLLYYFRDKGMHKNKVKEA